MVERLIRRGAALACVAGLASVAPGVQAQATIEPASLAKVLPPPWSGLTREPIETSSSDTPPRSQASARYKNEARQSFRLSIVDEGAAAARVYRDETAAYLRTDVRNEQQRSLMVGGRKALLTRYTPERVEVETFVADRFVLRVYCVMASDDICADALNRFNYAVIERPKP